MTPLCAICGGKIEPADYVRLWQDELHRDCLEEANGYAIECEIQEANSRFN